MECKIDTTLLYELLLSIFKMGRKWLSSGVRKNVKRGKQNEEKRGKEGIKLKALRHFSISKHTVDYFRKDDLNNY